MAKSDIYHSVSLEYCAPQSSSSSSAAGSGASGLYLDAYEVSFPLEENAERPPAYHLNQGQQMMDGTPSLLHLQLETPPPPRLSILSESLHLVLLLYIYIYIYIFCCCAARECEILFEINEEPVCLPVFLQRL